MKPTNQQQLDHWSSLVLEDITRLGKHHQLFEPEPYVLCKAEPSPAMRRADDQWKYRWFRKTKDEERTGSFLIEAIPVVKCCRFYLSETLSTLLP